MSNTYGNIANVYNYEVLKNNQKLLQHKNRQRIVIFLVLVAVLLWVARTVYVATIQYKYVYDKLNALKNVDPKKGFDSIAEAPSGLKAVLCMQWPWYNELCYGDKPFYIASIFALYYSPNLAECMKEKSIEAELLNNLFALAEYNANKTPAFSVNEYLCMLLTENPSATNPISRGLNLEKCYPVCSVPPKLLSDDSSQMVLEATTEAITFGALGISLLSAVNPIAGLLGGVLGGVLGFSLGFVSSKAEQKKQKEEAKELCKSQANCYFPEGSSNCDSKTQTPATLTCTQWSTCKKQNGMTHYSQIKKKWQCCKTNKIVDNKIIYENCQDIN